MISGKRLLILAGSCIWFGFFLLTTVAAECIEGDCQTGYGVYVMDDGHRYEGDWAKGKPQGKGKAIMPNGNIYEGTFDDGLWSGQGIETYPDGRQYVGEFKDSRYHGKGKVLTPDGGIRPPIILPNEN